MDREVIVFKKFNLPLSANRLIMSEGKSYRGLHSHSAIEVVKVNGGVLHCAINGIETDFKKGQTVFINTNTSHRLFPTNADIFYLQFDLSAFEGEKTQSIYSFLAHVGAKPFLVLDNCNEVNDLLDKIESKYKSDSKESRFYLKGYIFELIGFMYSKGFISPATLSKEKFKKIEPIVLFLQQNFRAPLSLDEICSAVKYNKYTVCHTFKAVTGSSVFDYVNFLRVQYAVGLLSDTDFCVSQIAAECGFSTPTYFNRVFSRVMGSSPSVYRKFLTQITIRG